MKVQTAILTAFLLLGQSILPSSVNNFNLLQPATAYAEETTIPEEGVEVTVNHVTYKLQSDGTLRISTDGQRTELTSWYSVFKSNAVLKPYKDLILKIIFEEGFISISGFVDPVPENCTYIKLPDSCTTVGKSCFYGFSKLETVKFGKNLTSIGDGAFYNNNITKINFPSTLSKMTGTVFNKTGLKTIDLPAGVNMDAGLNYGTMTFYEMPAVSTLIVRGNYTVNKKADPDSYAIRLNDGVYLKKIVYMADEWNVSLLEKPTQHINSNTIIYCTEANYDSIYGALSATGAKFHKIADISDMADSDLSDDNVSLADILYDVEEVTDGDELNIPIEGETGVAVIRLSVPTEVGFVISPTTKSKFITKPFKIVNQTGAPVDFKLTKLHRTTETNSIKSVPHNYKNREAEDWVKLGQEETEEGIALKVMFDVTGGDNFTSTTDMLWEDPVESLGDNTYVDLAFDTDGFITGKLGGLYGLAWSQEYTGSYELTGEVHLRN